MTGNNSFELESVESTQIHLKDLLDEQQLPEGTLVFTHDQTGGRGTDGNFWESGKGMNLTFSFVWYPFFLKAEEQFRMSTAITLAIFDFVAPKVKTGKVSIKWPNDIYIDDKKVAGILIENSIMNNEFKHSIIGIGLNINQIQFISSAPNPISLKMATGRTYDIYECLDEICKLLDLRYEELKNNKSGTGKEYTKNLYRFNELSLYYYKGSEIKGRIRGVNEFGLLLLETDDGKTLECEHKEIQFLN